MVQQNPAKLLTRFLFNALALGFSLSMIVVVAVTQTNGRGERFWPVPPEKSADWVTGASNTYCALNHDAVGICTYTYFLGGIGIIAALAGMALAIVSTITGIPTPNLTLAAINSFSMIWWLVGSIVIGVFVSRVNIIAARPPTGVPSWAPRMFGGHNAARTWILLIAVFSTIIYAIHIIVNIYVAITETQSTKERSEALLNNQLNKSTSTGGSRRAPAKQNKSLRMNKYAVRYSRSEDFCTDMPETIIP